MKKYSCSYNGINPNFVISDIEKKQDIDYIQSGFLDILSNIIMRGVPTVPSQYLINEIGDDSSYQDGCRYYINISCGDLKWDKIIKGGNNINYASDFYNNCLKKHSKAFGSFHLTLPECPMQDIQYHSYKDKHYIIERSAVDFYDPFHMIITEIDGSQHNEKMQRAIDVSRDMYFDKQINTYRIPVQFFNEADKTGADSCYQKIVSELSQLWKESDAIAKECRIAIKFNESKKIIWQLIARFQVIILELFRNGIFLFDDKCQYTVKCKCLSSNVENSKNDSYNKLHKDAFNLAYKDIQIWLTKMSELNGTNIAYPTVNIVIDNKDQDDICDVLIDIRIGIRYDQKMYTEFTNNHNDCIYIRCRDDYFLYDRLANVDKDIYSYAKNYYQVYCNDFRFNKIDIRNEKQKKALEFFVFNIFGHEKFRPKQPEIIASGLNKDVGTVGLLPTGSGKSVCFQLISMLTSGVSFVISPLKVLMDDQCENLYSRNHINAFFINGDSSKVNYRSKSGALAKRIQNRDIAEALYYNNAKIVYISPERFLDNDFAKFAHENANRISNIVIDEVHCLSEWGHDFRASYLLIFNILKNRICINENTLLIGTSATSSPRVTDDIITEFKTIKQAVNVVSGTSLKRDELKFEVIRIPAEYKVNNNDKNKDIDCCFDDKLKKMFINDMIHKRKLLCFSAYTSNGNKARGALSYHNMLSDIAKELHEKIEVYTSKGNGNGNNSAEKERVYHDFKSGKCHCIVATKAFGMGIDIQDIRHTVHLNLSSSVESLYQEMGRAGRDKKPSLCSILYLSDSKIEQEIMNVRNADDASLKSVSVDSCGSLAKPLFLMQQNNVSPKTEAECICNKIIPFIKNHQSFPLSAAYTVCNSDKDPSESFNHCFDAEEKKDFQYFNPSFQKRLYKMYILGIIDIWDIAYSQSLDNPTYSVHIITLDVDSIIDNLHRYIRKYNITYTYTGEHTLEAVVGEMCKWSFDNFQKYRFRSLMTLHEIVSTFTDSDSFMERIENYFNDNESIKKAAIIDGAYNLSDILKEDPVATYDQLQRYVAEYNENPIIAYIEGITTLRLGGRYDTEYYHNRLIDGVKYYLRTEELQSILNDTAKYLSEEQLKIFLYIISEDTALNKELCTNDSVIYKIFDNFGFFNTEISDAYEYGKLQQYLTKINTLYSDRMSYIEKLYKNINDKMNKPKPKQ